MRSDKGWSWGSEESESLGSEGDALGSDKVKYLGTYFSLSFSKLETKKESPTGSSLLPAGIFILRLGSCIWGGGNADISFERGTEARDRNLL
jgi:hypothetical protein